MKELRWDILSPIEEHKKSVTSSTAQPLVQEDRQRDTTDVLQQANAGAPMSHK